MLIAMREMASGLFEKLWLFSHCGFVSLVGFMFLFHGDVGMSVL